jgi:hypothetical protein
MSGDEWIPVNEKLPPCLPDRKVSEVVMIWTEGNEPGFSRAVYFDDYRHGFDPWVTHWQPVPPGPKEIAEATK